MLTVLVVEDDRDLRESAENTLGVAGYHTFAAGDADDALTRLRNHPEIDLLFTDVQMAGPANGFALARAAAKMRPDLKVLYATSRPAELLRPGSPIDAAQVLRKPYQSTELQRAVRWLLQPPE
jgi:CheY-like chemotaxis protein